MLAPGMRLVRSAVDRREEPRLRPREAPMKLPLRTCVVTPECAAISWYIFATASSRTRRHLGSRSAAFALVGRNSWQAVACWCDGAFGWGGRCSRRGRRSCTGAGEHQGAYFGWVDGDAFAVAFVEGRGNTDGSRARRRMLRALVASGLDGLCDWRADLAVHQCNVGERALRWMCCGVDSAYSVDGCFVDGSKS